MGYILPVNSYQSQQYANRLADDPHFARISQLHRVNQVASFQERFDQFVSEEEKNEEKDNQKEKKSQLANVPSQSKVHGYVNPNPANLSPAIAKAIGKGVAINAYV